MATHYDVAAGYTRKVQIARNVLFYRLPSLQEALDEVRTLNLDTVEGRNEALAALDNVNVTRGRNLFTMVNPGARFPNGWDDIFASELDQEFTRQMINLRRLLTYRDTNVAKDTQAGRQQGAPAIGITAEQTSQSIQDAKKAITEMIIAIKQHLAKPEMLWDMERVERELGLAWV